MAPAQGWDVSSVLPHLQWGAPIPLPHHSSDGSVFTWGHRAAQSTNVQYLLGVPSAGSAGKGLSQAHSARGSAHLYLGEAWHVWPLQLRVSVEGSRQLPSFSWTTAGYCASGMCIVSSGQNHIKWVSLTYMEIFAQWSFWAIWILHFIALRKTLVMILTFKMSLNMHNLIMFK